MKYIVVESCIYDSNVLDRPRVWAFKTKQEALNYAHMLCSDWIAQYDEDDLKEIDEQFFEKGFYEYENGGGSVSFDVQLNGGHVYFDYEGEVDVRVFEI